MDVRQATHQRKAVPPTPDGHFHDVEMPHRVFVVMAFFNNENRRFVRARNLHNCQPLRIDDPDGIAVNLEHDTFEGGQLFGRMSISVYISEPGLGKGNRFLNPADRLYLIVQFMSRFCRRVNLPLWQSSA